MRLPGGRRSLLGRPELRRRVVVAGLLIAVAGFIVASDTLHALVAELVVWAEQVIAEAPVLGKVVFVLLAMISAMLAFFSSAVLAPIAIYAWGQTTCFVLLWLGWFLGGIASFAVGRYLGRSAVAAVVGSERVAHWETQVSERSRFIHVLLFQAMVPSEIPGYLLGMLRYRFLLYLVALAITELPYALATVYLGDSFLKRDSTVFVALALGAVGIAAWLWLWAKPRPADRGS